MLLAIKRQALVVDLLIHNASATSAIRHFYHPNAFDQPRGDGQPEVAADAGLRLHQCNVAAEHFRPVVADCQPCPCRRNDGSRCLRLRKLLNRRCASIVMPMPMSITPNCIVDRSPGKTTRPPQLAHLGNYSVADQVD
jgi:hypothetical protein